MSRLPTHPPGIGDYAIIGDCRSAALVSGDGSLDWLCWPRFDSPSLFAALLDPDVGGHFAVRPAAPCRTTRRYVGDTNVLETTFRGADGVVRLIDLMPVSSEEDKHQALVPDHEILRAIEGVEGTVELDIRYEPRPDYARRRPRVRDRGALGFCTEHGGQVLILRGDVPLRVVESGAVHGRVTVRAGERRFLSLVFGEGEPAVLPLLGEEAERKIRRSLEWWEAWAARCQYAGPYRESVIRSALTLKLLSYAPSGAVVAAPTTSLPEHPGGVRNWDYRYCWLRDASLTLQALFDLGYAEEAEAFMSWLLHTTRITRPELQVLYTVFGEAELPERELPHLAGFAGSRPVRVGNDAHGQLQLDIYGEVMDAAYEFANRGGTIDRVTAGLLTGFGHAVCRRWQEPDEGIWEIRGGRRHHTYSKVMCWVALDRLIRLHEEAHLRGDVAAFRAVRDRIRREVGQRGYDDEAGTFVSVLDGHDVDAVLLLLARYGFVDPSDPAMLRTCERIERDLGVRGLLYRYPPASDGLPPGEGAFGICSFWWVATRAAQGDVEGAVRAFDHLLGFGNDVGLFAEEIAPDSGAPLGNFPQAFTHVGLIDAALTLEHASGTRKRRSGTERIQQTGVHL